MNIFDLITRAQEIKILVDQGGMSLISLIKSIRCDDSLSDKEVAARALAVTLLKGEAEVTL